MILSKNKEFKESLLNPKKIKNLNDSYGYNCFRTKSQIFILKYEMIYYILWTKNKYNTIIIKNIKKHERNIVAICHCAHIILRVLL